MSDIESTCAALEKAGVQCVWDEEVAGVRRFYAHDPWGNRLEFTEPTFRISTLTAEQAESGAESD